MREDSIVYEYISINVKRDLEQMYIDCYKNFGWLHISNEKKDYYINSNPNPNTIEIKFKRDRNTKNKDELQKLQKKCERAFLTIDKLEKMPQALAISYVLMIGVIATIFMTKLDSQDILEKEEYSLSEQIRNCIIMLEHEWSSRNININANINLAVNCNIVFRKIKKFKIYVKINFNML